MFNAIVITWALEKDDSEADRNFSLYLVSQLLWLVFGTPGVVSGHAINLIVYSNCIPHGSGKLADGLNYVVVVYEYFLTR